jgi:Leucine-rich repeat (LRR) protein
LTELVFLEISLFTPGLTHEIKPLVLPDLSRLTELSSLSVRYAEMTDLSPLLKLPSLFDLSLRFCIIDDYSALSELTGLRRLGINDSDLSDVTPLAGLTELLHLNLDRNQIEDLSPVQYILDKTQEMITASWNWGHYSTFRGDDDVGWDAIFEILQDNLDEIRYGSGSITTSIERQQTYWGVYVYEDD